MPIIIFHPVYFYVDTLYVGKNVQILSAIYYLHVYYDLHDYQAGRSSQFLRSHFIVLYVHSRFASLADFSRFRINTSQVPLPATACSVKSDESVDLNIDCPSDCQLCVRSKQSCRFCQIFVASSECLNFENLSKNMKMVLSVKFTYS